MIDDNTIVQGAETGFPYIASPTFTTAAGTRYLRRPGVHLISRPHVRLDSLDAFLDGFGTEAGFGEYLADPSTIDDGAQICKTAGQLCYLSFGRARTFNIDAERYFANIRASGHGSVLEHAAFSFLLYGVSRSMTHELVRHRAGFGFSQVSQRYVSGRVLRFVERPEFARDAELHAMFESRIDRAASDHAELEGKLSAAQSAGAQALSADARTDLRKNVQQAARALLPNESEAPILVTGNARSWRHFLEMRASEHAETEIRELGFRVYVCLAAAEPLLFSDYEVVHLPDGTRALTTRTPKV